MLNKLELRTKLDQLSPSEAFSLALKETAFWDVHQIQQLTSFHLVVQSLSSFHPIEAAALIHSIQPLAGHLLLYHLKRFVARPNRAIKTAKMHWKMEESEARELVERLCQVVQAAEQGRCSAK
ncbi:MAG: hypothetical protein HYZ51_04155 [Candidatus Doudnabacteria bacterium]|nr:hypothetical protein [Candidatus Doudnabacteria bacterium]